MTITLTFDLTQKPFDDIDRLAILYRVSYNLQGAFATGELGEDEYSRSGLPTLLRYERESWTGTERDMQQDLRREIRNGTSQ